jgi:hypothetical protein
MKITKWGSIIEKDGKISLLDFQIDPEGATLFSEAHKIEMALDLVTERLLKIKQNIVGARQIQMLNSLPIEQMPRA